MEEDQDTETANPLVVAWMLIRALAGTVIWIAIFLGALMGYLPLPLLLLGVFLAIYTAVDAVRLRARR